MGAPMWTAEEDRILTKGRSVGMRFHEIGAKIGRTKKACMARYAVLTGDPGLHSANAANDNIRRASVELGEAINRLLARMDPPTRNYVLGSHAQHTPGTERIYRGQMAEREFARPIGEIIAPIVAEIMDRAEAA
jgi:hypothetical protein